MPVFLRNENPEKIERSLLPEMLWKIIGTQVRHDPLSPTAPVPHARSHLSVRDSPFFGERVIRTRIGLRLASFPAPETGILQKETGLDADLPVFTPEGRDRVWQSYSSRSAPEPGDRPDRQETDWEFLRDSGG